MTFEEAKIMLEKHQAWARSESRRYSEAVDIAIECIDKQIPKEPILEADGYADGELVYDVWRCPNCDKSYEVDYDSYDCCPNCGQRVYAEDEE